MASASVRQVVAAESGAGASAGAMVEDSDDTFVCVEELQRLGINAADIAKLKAAGYSTVGLILSTPSKRLLEIKGISDTKLEKIAEACKRLKPTGFVTGTEALVRSKSRMHITTGCKELDDILGGGIETGSVTEVFGEFRCGKTQLCATLCVTSQMSREHGGGAGKVIVIDTENAFRVERVAQIAETRYGLDPAAVLDNVIFASALTHEHQCELLAAAMAKIAEDDEPFRLLVIDSIMGLYRVEFSGRGELAERQQKLASHVRELVKTAQEFNVAVLVTNQVTADPGNMFVPDAKKPVGGNILAHYVTNRVYFRKGKGNQRIAKIYAGPLPERECTFSLTDGGVADAE